MFFHVQILKGAKSNIFTCKLYLWVIFTILFTRLLCDNSHSLTYEPQNIGGKVQHFHMPAVWLYISCRLALHSNNSNLNVGRPVSFCNQYLTVATTNTSPQRGFSSIQTYGSVNVNQPLTKRRFFPPFSSTWTKILVFKQFLQYFATGSDTSSCQDYKEYDECLSEETQIIDFFTHCKL